jgi:hypothetical protein
MHSTEGEVMADYALTSSGAFYGLTVSGGKVTEVNNLDNPDGIAEMKQRIIIAIKTHLGEKLLDNTLGLPWAEQILVKNPNLGQITSSTRTYLTTRVEGVLGVRTLDVTLDTVTRVMNWNIDCETSAGVTGPFNLSVTL